MTTYIRLGIQAVASGTGEAGRMIKAAALEVQTRKKHQAAYLFGLSIQEKDAEMVRDSFLSTYLSSAPKLST